MEVKEALETIGYTQDDKAMLRQCCYCDGWLDEASEVLAEYRKVLKHAVSCGLHPTCEEAYIAKYVGKNIL